MYNSPSAIQLNPIPIARVFVCVWSGLNLIEIEIGDRKCICHWDESFSLSISPWVFAVLVAPKIETKNSTNLYLHSTIWLALLKVFCIQSRIFYCILLMTWNTLHWIQMTTNIRNSLITTFNMLIQTLSPAIILSLLYYIYVRFIILLLLRVALHYFSLFSFCVAFFMFPVLFFADRAYILIKKK